MSHIAMYIWHSPRTDGLRGSTPSPVLGTPRSRARMWRIELNGLGQHPQRRFAPPYSLPRSVVEARVDRTVIQELCYNLKDFLSLKQLLNVFNSILQVVSSRLWPASISLHTSPLYRNPARAMAGLLFYLTRCDALSQSIELRGGKVEEKHLHLL
jgi:hypothetical protein